MEPVIVWYLRMSLLYFLTGALTGVFMLTWPSEAGYFLPVHVHLNLLGFMSMMIYGVGYHILPRFSGTTIYSKKIMSIQFWLANAGLLGMAAGWLSGQDGVLVVSALLTLAAVMLFVLNLFKTIKTA
ncbi:MAG: cbb3-type cytochrome c oxidase subunit I [Nitrospira sp.]|nr:cbb3-type cytochrome c oxidase subunit I [bacterium]MBL7049584.1 cbb3-type cytochrome c oxidase subunit I [Nitrospira sp.]